MWKKKIIVEGGFIFVAKVVGTKRGNPDISTIKIAGGVHPMAGRTKTGDNSVLKKNMLKITAKPWVSEGACSRDVIFYLDCKV